MTAQADQRPLHEICQVQCNDVLFNVRFLLAPNCGCVKRMLKKPTEGARNSEGAPYTVEGSRGGVMSHSRPSAPIAAIRYRRDLYADRTALALTVLRSEAPSERADPERRTFRVKTWNSIPTVPVQHSNVRVHVGRALRCDARLVRCLVGA